MDSIEKAEKNKSTKHYNTSLYDNVLFWKLTTAWSIINMRVTVYICIRRKINDLWKYSRRNDTRKNVIIQSRWITVSDTSIVEFIAECQVIVSAVRFIVARIRWFSLCFLLCYSVSGHTNGINSNTETQKHRNTKLTVETIYKLKVCGLMVTDPSGNAY